ncbi:lytic transglycosylase domain-containing protein [Methylocapsa palsarum]|uniref:Transglycosylase SLT domain-containing protein n=1 Tax=Methylocapsa palsarum TaxID=1612308 RepID=A0A1I4C4Q3_9HYPH|nr:lytic transglycosylase domain-containing protein [Methylocapsa palsarum]SFK76094.1 Transglycosylase SLT domain-containing protein [Methylocapsa palsarum]
MLRISSLALAALVPTSLAFAAERPTNKFDDEIARHAAAHGVPEKLIHRVIMRESRYQPRLVHNACYGMMQIKYSTAHSMGYSGPVNGLLDPHVNLTYAIPYLANAYRIAGGDEDRAVVLYSAGYYFTAKQKHMLGDLRTASSEPVKPIPDAAAVAAASAPQQAPGFSFASLFSPPDQAAQPAGQ